MVASDKTELDSCLEMLARTMNEGHLDHVAISREQTGDVIVTVRKNDTLIRVGWVAVATGDLQWTKR